MTMGAGKYDEFATYVREQTKARAVAVIVTDGNLGSGFAQQFESSSEEELEHNLLEFARCLRSVADAMQADARRLRAKARGN